MSAPASVSPVIYPESDGKPMADNTVQFRWIQFLSGNLLIRFRGRNDVFVGGNLFWYPVENFINIVQAPDVFVVLDRPPGERSSYLQHEENGVPMTVVFEIRSPNDNDTLMREKLEFYDEYEVEEYYYYDPERNRFVPYIRRGGALAQQRLRKGTFTSPRLEVRFQTASPEMLVFYPDGTPFMSTVELKEQAEQERREKVAAQQQAQVAQQQAQVAQQEMAAAQERMKRLAELSRRALRGQASPVELAELNRLLEEIG